MTARRTPDIAAVTKRNPYATPVQIVFRNGTTKDLVCTQWSLSQFAVHAMAKGWQIDLEQSGLMAVTMLRYQAWAEMHRDAKTRPSFETWDSTVDEVNPTKQTADVAPPTLPATSAGTSA